MKHRHSGRHGWSLIETIAAVTVGSVVFGLAVAIAHTFFRLDQNLQTERQTWASLNRLAEQFREDAHAAEAVTAPGQRPLTAKVPAKGDTGPPPAWIFHFPANRQVEYSATGEGLARIERVGDKVVSREGYVLPPGTLVKLQPPGPSSRMVVLQLVLSESVGRKPAAQPLRIEAAAGLDRRFASKGGRP